MTTEQKRPVREPLRHLPTGNFPKSERLCSRKEIEELFARGGALLAYPLKCTYKISRVEEDLAGGLTENGGTPILRMMAIVPKRNHKLAVTRNLFRRRIREAYRRNRGILAETATVPRLCFTLAFSYIAKRTHSYAEIENAIQEIFQKLGDIPAGGRS